MATRLFARTNDITILEKLAGVPAGTKAVLDTLRAEGNQMEDEFAVFNHIRTNPDAERLDVFLTFGWGRVNADVVRSLGYPTCGAHTDEPSQVRHIGLWHNLSDEVINLLIESGGVYWN